MRSSTPIPGNPWPHDMALTVDDRPQHLIEMLWIREAHALRPDVLPLLPLLSDAPQPAAVQVDDSTRSTWRDAWPRIWAEVLAHAGQNPDPAVFDRLSHTASGSPERQSLLDEIVGPSWAGEFGSDALTDPSYVSWDREGTDRYLAALTRGHDGTPERRDLDALVPAWRAGLTTVVSIPCQGQYTRRLSATALLVTEETRSDSAHYRQALTWFATGAAPQ
ncbi:hypothetical protein LQ938_07420 [Microbacterium sp. cx-55]|uniref:hypothetical protein n=1 Tax=Microbacterium sp. cx-55 TaxID=2875948 RepID=UPI001CBBF514|nr:hypothetical protein [Microbacterium sp. cx-55]MBZ4486425.1 hypothetical protein [Microbacterium sp. cx-55]UGB36602.1 hypothetical protein LQ938_07420 [Microbacterium sp. cx-55]